MHTRLPLKPILILFLSLLAFANFNAFFFHHLHLLDDNRIILHAHPFQQDAQHSSAFPEHSHTNLQLTIFHLIISAVFSLVVLLLIFPLFLAENGLLKYRDIPAHSTLPLLQGHPRRAPPLAWSSI